MATQGIFLDPDNPELRKAWAQFPDPAMYNDAMDEALQYMGTIGLASQPGVYVHQFRHRAVPRTNQRHYWNIVATEGWQPT